MYSINITILFGIKISYMRQFKLHLLTKATQLTFAIYDSSKIIDITSANMFP